ncbi:ABC transporter permease [Paenibacillus mendelii]|uniref:ABC transporter permease n=1 Tax=Paenibacillus mendelii TaxID=206163 RepID=A0ABV6JHN4_9BACL|nr:ABC transporter permease [Paenibacillus mendelii]MCQ6558192.1 ABC transporter permease [Paenibacillus mendelii]
MYAWLTMAWFELIRFVRMKSVIALMFLLPLLLIFLLGNAFREEMKPVKVAVHLADEDALGTMIRSYLQDKETADYMVATEVSTEDEAREQVRNGTADFGVVIPTGFSARVMAGDEAAWNVYPGRDDNRNIMAESVLQRLLTQIEVRQTAAAVLGANSAGLPQENDVPRALPGIKTEHVGGGKDPFGSVTAIQYYAGAYLIMFLLYSGMSGILSLINERELGTIGRLYGTPHPIWLLVLGKLTGFGLFAVLQAMAIIGFSWLVYGVQWGGSPFLMILVCLLTSASAVGLSAIIASFVRTSKATLNMFSVLTIFMTFLSGGMVADLSGTIRRIGDFTINHWATVTIRRIMDNGDMDHIWQGIGVLAAIAAVLMFIGAMRLKKVVRLHA